MCLCLLCVRLLCVLFRCVWVGVVGDLFCGVVCVVCCVVKKNVTFVCLSVCVC